MKEYKIIGIDGDSAAGKSTYAQSLALKIEAEIIHMDDFFLPIELRTSQRLSEVGGNFDYDRFEKEVYQPLRSGKPFSYRVYDCSTGTFKSERLIENCGNIIVEGAYSLHPKFEDMYSTKIFMCVSPKLQCERILRRNGEAALNRFLSMWIPKEKEYQSKYKIMDGCDEVIKDYEDR